MNVKYAQLTRISALGLLISAISACGGGGGDSNGGGGGGQAPVAQGNPPTVTADPRSITNKGANFSVSASASDPDGDAISYQWTQSQGAPVSNLTGADTSAISFNAPNVVDTIQFTVTVTAGGQSASDSTLVMVLDGSDNAIFVDGTSTSSGAQDGSINAPFSSLRDAIEVSNATKDFYIKSLPTGEFYDVRTGGPTNGRLDLGSGQSLYGGYYDDWLRDTQNRRSAIVGNARVFLISNVNNPTTVSGLEVTATLGASPSTSEFEVYPLFVNGGDSQIEIRDNLFITEDADQLDPSFFYLMNYGLRVKSVPTVTVADNTIVVGNARSAPDEDKNFSSVRAGVDGESANNTNGADGGAANRRRLETGGDGGEGARSSFQGGDEGKDGSGRSVPFVSGGAGGRGGFTGSGTTKGGPGGDGSSGSTGVIGSSGRGGVGYGSLETFGIGLGRGAPGTDGYGGGGGGGGGGGSAGSAGTNGGGGGGGGEGGDGGKGGFAGIGGGVSVGIEFVNVPFGTITDNDITTGAGGTGGMGGAGGDGAAGGAGGAGDAGNKALIGDARGGDGGKGGRGGTGGPGGFGGGGGGGPSFGIFLGSNTGPDISGNRIQTGTGGIGAPSQGNADNDAGKGGWSVGIFDGDLSDGVVPTLSNNSITAGQGGTDGAPATGTGESLETNL